MAGGRQRGKPPEQTSTKPIEHHWSACPRRALEAPAPEYSSLGIVTAAAAGVNTTHSNCGGPRGGHGPRAGGGPPAGRRRPTPGRRRAAGNRRRLGEGGGPDGPCGGEGWGNRRAGVWKRVGRREGFRRRGFHSGQRPSANEGHCIERRRPCIQDPRWTGTPQVAADSALLEGEGRPPLRREERPPRDAVRRHPLLHRRVVAPIPRPRDGRWGEHQSHIQATTRYRPEKYFPLSQFWPLQQRSTIHRDFEPEVLGFETPFLFHCVP